MTTLPENVHTTSRNAFDIKKAISQGCVGDSQGRIYTIISHSNEFIIVEDENKNEHCFNRAGLEFSENHPASLTTPFSLTYEVLPYIVYNTKTMIIIGSYKHIGQADKETNYRKAENLTLIRIKNTLNKELLTELGITKTYWTSPDKP